MLSPDPPLGMHDGFETKRSRGRGPEGCEALLVQLGKDSTGRGSHVIEAIEADFSYFVNNNPVALEIWGLN